MAAGWRRVETGEDDGGGLGVKIREQRGRECEKRRQECNVCRCGGKGAFRGAEATPRAVGGQGAGRSWRPEGEGGEGRGGVKAVTENGKWRADDWGVAARHGTSVVLTAHCTRAARLRARVMHAA